MTSLAQAILRIKQQQEGNNSIKHFIADSYPNTVQALQIIDHENSQPKKRKGFNLVPIESKKQGVMYYARFYHKGKMLPTKFHTHTNDIEKAEKFARENRTRLVEGYLQRKDGQLYKSLESFYECQTDAGDFYRLRLSDRCRKEYHAVILNKFLPFLKQEKIMCFGQLTVIAINKFQDHLLSKGVKPQTVNNNLKAVKKALAGMARTGILKDNPADRIKGIPVRQDDQKARGCYELGKLKGVFNKRWKDETSFLLCLLIYTTGMRNSEINRMRLDDIINIEGCRFIQVKKSKTASGIRLVPLHEYVYRKLKAWAVKNEKAPQSPLFGFRRADVFINANSCLRRQLGVSEAYTEAENITFYSGRHFWKTLMNSGGLGEDIEEVFMGHKVTSNVAKLYNHRDKLGKKMTAKKARQVFSILDRCIFKTKP